MCARHVYANLRKQWRGVIFREVFWKIVKSTNEVLFKKHMKKMQDLDAKTWEFLEKKDRGYFYRLYFSRHAKCDSIDNNMAEIFNGSIVEARYFPIVSMLREIFKSVTKRVAQRKSWVAKLEGSLCPRIMVKVDKYKDMARYWQATRAENGFYSVEHGTESYVVNLKSGIMYLQRLGIKWNPLPSFLGSDEGREIKPLHFCP